MTTTSSSSPGRTLTAKQEAYAIYLFRGLEQAIAYEKAGYVVINSTSTSIREMACHLANTPEIQARLAELRGAVARKSRATVEERVERMTQILRHDVESPVSAGHVIAAAAEISKLLGSYPAEKRQVAHHVTFEVVYRDAPELPQGGAVGLLPAPVDQSGTVSPDGPVSEGELAVPSVPPTEADNE